MARKNQVENAFGAVEAQLTRRRDLVPNLVEAVKRYMAYWKRKLGEGNSSLERARLPEDSGKQVGSQLRSTQ